MTAGLYGTIWRRTRRAQVLAIALSIVVFPLSMVPLELQRRIINEGVGTRNADLLFLLGGLYLAVVLLQGGLKYGMNMCRGRISERLTADLRKTISHADIEETQSEPGESAQKKKGTTVAMVAAEVEPLGGFAGESFSVPIVQAGALLSVIGYMIVVEPSLALASLGIFVPQVIVIPIVQAAINRRNKRRIELIRDVGDTLTDIDPEPGREAAEHSETDHVSHRIDTIYGLRIAIYRLKYALKFFRNLINHLSELAVLLVGGWMVIEGATDLGTIVAFLSGLQRVRDPWRDLVAYFRQASDARVKYGLIRSALDAKTPAV